MRRGHGSFGISHHFTIHVPLLEPFLRLLINCLLTAKWLGKHLLWRVFKKILVTFVELIAIHIRKTILLQRMPIVPERRGDPPSSNPGELV